MSANSAPFTFGRGADCDLVLGVDDTTISRSAGSIACRNDLWLVSNSSVVRPLYAIGPNGLKTIITPHSDQLLSPGTTSILIVGAALTHEIRVFVPEFAGAPATPIPSEDIAAGEPTMVPRLTARERQAIAALAQRYFHPYPHYDSRPLTCNEAAKSLGLPAATVRKRLERVRAKLVTAGVPGLDGIDSRAEICEFLVGTGAVAADDLGSVEHTEP